MTSVQEVVYSIHKSLTEWGVHPYSFDEKHKKFRYQIKNDTIKYFQESQQVTDVCDIVREDLPEEIEYAIRKVLTHEIKGKIDRFTLIEDRLSVTNRNGVLLTSLPPYYANSKYSNGRMNSSTPCKRPDYAKCSAEELDPFNRFVVTEYAKTEYFFRMWFDAPNLVDGNAFEAIVSCHAMHKEACYNCKSRKTIQWIGKKVRRYYYLF